MMIVEPYTGAEGHVAVGGGACCTVTWVLLELMRTLNTATSMVIRDRSYLPNLILVRRLSCCCFTLSKRRWVDDRGLSLVLSGLFAHLLARLMIRYARTLARATYNQTFHFLFRRLLVDPGTP